MSLPAITSDIELANGFLQQEVQRVYLTPFNIASNELARKLQVSPGLVSRLVNGKTDLSPAMTLKLSKVLGRSPESWLLMQDNYDLWQVRQRVDLQNYETMVFHSRNFDSY